MNALRGAQFGLQVLVAGLLGACASGGGGGYGGVSPPAPPPPPGVITPGPPPVVPPPAPPLVPPGQIPDPGSSEYTNNWGIGGVGAISAWSREGGTGAGVTIAVIDDGVDPNHPELAGRISPASKDINSVRDALTTSLSHGSELSSLIAGNFNGAQTVGVAYEATILAVRADNGQGSFNDQQLADALDYAREQGADIVNFSLGSPAASSPAWQMAMQRATAAGMIIVASAGNDGRSGATEVNYPGFLANSPSVSNGLIIVAGGLNPDGSVNTVSNPPGQAQNFYLVAPAWEIIVPDFGPAGPVPGYQQCWPNPNNCTGLVEIQGTSYASPLTAGAAAVLMSAFPGLSPHDVVALLLSTTDDIGAPGTDALTGRGRLNLAKAFQPVGPVAAPLTLSVAASPTTSLGVVGPAFGDGFSDDAGEWAVASFDAFERTYRLDLAANWLVSAGGPALAAQAPRLWRAERGRGGALMQFAPADDVAPQSLRLPIERAEFEAPAMRIETDLAAGFTLALGANGARADETEARSESGHLGLVNSEQSLRLSRQMTDSLAISIISERGAARVGLAQAWSERSAAAVEAAYARGPFGLEAKFGEVAEDQGVLGFVWADAFGATPGAASRFAALAGHVALGPRLSLHVEAESGAAELARSGWLAIAEPLRTSAFAAELSYAIAPPGFDGAGGALSFTASQPLRVEAGALSASLPTATEYGRESLSYETRLIDVTPSGRELRFGLMYRAWLGERVSAFGEALYAIEPGHVRAADDAALVRLGLRARY